MRELLNLDENKLLFFDIETAPVQKEIEIGTPLYDSWEYKVNKEGDKTPKEIVESYKNQSSLYPEFAKIISVVVGKIKEDKINLVTFDHDNEKNLLNSLNELLNHKNYAKDKLCGFVNIGFDTPFIFKRMIINGIQPSRKVDSSGLKPWEVEEVDLSKIWQATSFNRASLINIATCFGLPSPKEDISGADVGKVYWNNPTTGLERISEYCRRDVITTINIFRKMCLREPLVCDKSTVLNKSSSNKQKDNDTNIITDLVNGVRYTKKHKEKLIQFLSELSDDDKKKCFDMLESVVSNAKGKKTNLSKKHIKELKEQV